MEWIIYSPEDIRDVAKWVHKELCEYDKKNGAVVMALTGPLGAGKTLFVKEIGKLLGIEQDIISPTFILERIYKAKKSFEHIHHIDVYRLKDSSETKPLRLDETFKKDNTLVLIEWGEKIQDILPKPHLEMKIEVKEGDTRLIHYEEKK